MGEMSELDEAIIGLDDDDSEYKKMFHQKKVTQTTTKLTPADIVLSRVRAIAFEIINKQKNDEYYGQTSIEEFKHAMNKILTLVSK